jgi:GNAT superfamily N-acetyltransferase
VLDIAPLSEGDRDEWKELARSFHGHFSGRPGRPAWEIDDEGYELTWQRILDGREIRGICARLDGRIVGIAHYLFHVSLWSTTGRCYMADLFVDPRARRRGVATAMIHWVAWDAEQHGAPRLYWNTEIDGEARPLYDKVASFEGYIIYTYSRPTAT